MYVRICAITGVELELLFAFPVLFLLLFLLLPSTPPKCPHALGGETRMKAAEKDKNESRREGHS